LVVIVIVIAKILFNCNLIVIGQNVIDPCLVGRIYLVDCWLT